MQYKNNTDAELLSATIAGHSKAFEEIYFRYATPLFKYIRKNIPVKEDCEEIIQDVFESLWSRHEQLTHITTLSGYLFTMARYKIIRYFQHSKVRVKYEEHFKLFEAVYDNNPEMDKDPQDLTAMIEKNLAALPSRCQEAIKLRLIENLSNSDIAKRMNISKGTVENYMVTALNHLKSCTHLHPPTVSPS